MSIVHPILFVDDNDDGEDNDKLLVYIEGEAVERVKGEIDALAKEGNHFTLTLTPWEHALLLHQYNKLLHLCDQHNAVMVLRGWNCSASMLKASPSSTTSYSVSHPRLFPFPSIMPPSSSLIRARHTWIGYRRIFRW